MPAAAAAAYVLPTVDEKAQRLVIALLCPDEKCDHLMCAFSIAVKGMVAADIKTPAELEAYRKTVDHVKAPPSVESAGDIVSRIDGAYAAIVESSVETATLATVYAMKIEHVYGKHKSWTLPLFHVLRELKTQIPTSVHMNASLDVTSRHGVVVTEAVYESVRSHLLNCVNGAIHDAPQRNPDELCLWELNQAISVIEQRASSLLGAVLTQALQYANAVVLFPIDARNERVYRRRRMGLIRELCSERYTGLDGLLCDVFCEMPTQRIPWLPAHANMLVYQARMKVPVIENSQHEYRAVCVSRSVAFECDLAMQHVIDARARITKYRSELADAAGRVIESQNTLIPPLRCVVQSYLAHPTIKNKKKHHESLGLNPI